MKKYLLLDGIFEATRMFSAAISAVYLTSCGLPLASVAQLKLIQSVACFVLEYPTGLIADLFGRRLSLLLSVIFGSAAFALYGLGRSWAVFALAEVALSLCLCLWSGAYEAYAVDSTKLDGNSAGLARFFHLNSSFNTACTLMAGFLGAWLADINPIVPYLVAASGMVGIAIWLLCSFPRDSVKPPVGQGKNPLRHALIESARLGLHPSLRTPFASVCLLQFLAQPLIYYWQPMFQRSEDVVGTGQLGTVFLAFQAAILAASYTASRLSDRAWMRGTTFKAAMLTGLAGALVEFSHDRSATLFTPLAWFCAAEVFYTLLMTSMKSEINERLPDPSLRASLMGALSTSARLGSIASLSLIGLYLGGGGEIANLFLFSGGLASGALMLSLFALNREIEEKRDAIPNSA